MLTRIKILSIAGGRFKEGKTEVPRGPIQFSNLLHETCRGSNTVTAPPGWTLAWSHWFSGRFSSVFLWLAARGRPTWGHLDRGRWRLNGALVSDQHGQNPRSFELTEITSEAIQWGFRPTRQVDAKERSWLPGTFAPSWTRVTMVQRPFLFHTAGVQNCDGVILCVFD